MTATCAADVGTGHPGTESKDFSSATFEAWGDDFYRRLSQHMRAASMSIGECGAGTMVCWAALVSAYGQGPAMSAVLHCPCCERGPSQATVAGVASKVLLVSCLPSVQHLQFAPQAVWQKPLSDALCCPCAAVGCVCGKCGAPALVAFSGKRQVRAAADIWNTSFEIACVSCMHPDWHCTCMFMLLSTDVQT